MSARYADLKGSKISTLTTIHSIQVSKFHKSLKSSSGAKLFQLQVCIQVDDEANRRINVIIVLLLVIKPKRNLFVFTIEVNWNRLRTSHSNFVSEYLFQ